MSDSLRRTLHGLEMQLLRPEVRCDRSAMERLLTEDFVEFGSSGRTFTRETMLQELAAETTPLHREISDFVVVLEAEGFAVVRYRSSGPATDGSGASVVSLRSSVWVQVEGDWRVRFHQGTRAAVDAG